MSETGFLRCVGQTNTLLVQGMGSFASPSCFPSCSPGEFIKFTNQAENYLLYLFIHLVWFSFLPCLNKMGSLRGVMNARDGVS